MHDFIDAFTLTVTLWIVRGCATHRDAIDLTKFLNPRALKNGTRGRCISM